MTTDRALELAEALLHEERRFPRHMHVQEVDEALEIIAKLREEARGR